MTANSILSTIISITVINTIIIFAITTMSILFFLKENYFNAITFIITTTVVTIIIILFPLNIITIAISIINIIIYYFY